MENEPKTPSGKNPYREDIKAIAALTVFMVVLILIMAGLEELVHWTNAQYIEAESTMWAVLTGVSVVAYFLYILGFLGWQQ